MGIGSYHTRQPQTPTTTPSATPVTPPRLNNQLMDLTGGFTGPNPNAPAAAATTPNNRYGNWASRFGGNDSLIRMLLAYAPPGGGQWGRNQ